MNKDIIKLLNLEDDCIVKSIDITNSNTKTITLEKVSKEFFCPLCNTRMHSKGVRPRKVKHQMIMDGYQLELKLLCRRYQCTNPLCSHMEVDSFNFVDKYRRVTNTTDFLIVESFRDHTLTFSAIARKFHVSPSYVHSVFKRYIHMERLPLSEILSIDEVYIKDGRNGKYALVLHDFVSAQPIDLVTSRRQNITEKYFANIDISERKMVRFLITDMYKPFINYASKYFPNAVVAVDSFHVTQWIINEIHKYIKSLTKKYTKRDEERHAEKESREHRKLIMRQSDEVYMLKKFSWLVLKNQEDVDYDQKITVDKHFKYFMSIYDKELALFKLAPELSEMRDLKEMYIKFNHTQFDDLSVAAKELEKLIDVYQDSKFEMYRNFSSLLRENFDEVVNSFIRVELVDEDGVLYERRLSNGPIESFNRIPKDMKRDARGFLDFEHARNRILFATRKDPVIRSPKR